MTTLTPNTMHLGLPFIEGSQAQKHVTHNEALRILDALVMLAVEDRDLSAPPPSPEEGARYIVKGAGSGAFADRDDQIASYIEGEWLFFLPRTGWTCYVQDEGMLLAWDGAAWRAALDVLGGVSELQNLTLLGLGVAADADNPFSATLNNALWAARAVADGGDGTLRCKLSKEEESKTASLLLQSGFAGRAEIGLTGDDDLHLKVSPDGSAWIDAMLFDRASGAAKINAGFFLTGSLAPARMTADQDDYDPPGLAGASVLRLSSDIACDITGLSGGGDGRVIVLVNVGANPIRLKDADASSSVENRFAFGSDITLPARQSAALWYDAETGRWRLLAAPSAAQEASVPADLDLMLALQQMQIADNAAAALVWGNRFADGFKSLAYVDVAGATNLDSGTTGMLKPSVMAGSGQIPAMTGATTGGVSVSANESQATFDAWKAADGTQTDATASDWASVNAPSGGAPKTLTVDLGSAVLVSRYELAASGWSSNTAQSFMARDWTLEGSDDGLSWTLLDTRTNAPAWSAAQGRTYQIASPASYRYYRLSVTATQNGQLLILGKIQLYAPDTPNNTIVASAPLSAATSPDAAKLVVCYKPIDSIALGTDLMFDVSRDGGTTWTDITMTDRFMSPSPIAGVHVLEGSVDLLGQPAGTEMKWRARSANGKAFELRGVCFNWNA